jgi:hypothetical protein
MTSSEIDAESCCAASSTAAAKCRCLIGEGFDGGMDMSTVLKSNDLGCFYMAEYCIEK